MPFVATLMMMATSATAARAATMQTTVMRRRVARDWRSAAALRMASGAMGVPEAACAWGPVLSEIVAGRGISLVASAPSFPSAAPLVPEGAAHGTPPSPACCSAAFLSFSAEVESTPL